MSQRFLAHGFRGRLADRDSRATIASLASTLGTGAMEIRNVVIVLVGIPGRTDVIKGVRRVARLRSHVIILWH